MFGRAFLSPRIEDSDMPDAAPDEVPSIDDDYDTYDMAGATCPECRSNSISGYTNNLAKFECNDCDVVFHLTITE